MSSQAASVKASIAKRPISASRVQIIFQVLVLGLLLFLSCPQLYRMYRKLPKKPKQPRQRKQLRNREKDWSGERI